MLKYRIRNSEVTKQKILGAALRNFADKGLYHFYDLISKRESQEIKGLTLRYVLTTLIHTKFSKKMRRL